MSNEWHVIEQAVTQAEAISHRYHSWCDTVWRNFRSNTC